MGDAFKPVTIKHVADDIEEIIGKQALAGVEAVEHTMLLIKETEVEMLKCFRNS